MTASPRSHAHTGDAGPRSAGPTLPVLPDWSSAAQFWPPAVRVAVVGTMLWLLGLLLAAATHQGHGRAAAVITLLAVGLGTLCAAALLLAEKPLWDGEQEPAGQDDAPRGTTTSRPATFVVLLLAVGVSGLTAAMALLTT